MSQVELKTFASWASYPLLDIYPCVLFPHKLTFYRLFWLINTTVQCVSFPKLTFCFWICRCLFCLSFVFLYCVWTVPPSSNVFVFATVFVCLGIVFLCQRVLMSKSFQHFSPTNTSSPIQESRKVQNTINPK